MKKLIVLLLVLVILISISGCSGKTTTSQPNEAPMTESPKAESPVTPEANNTLTLGETIDTGFVKFNIDSAVVDYKLGGSKGYRPATDGMQFFCLQGSIQNIAGNELNIYQLAGEMTFGGTYTYAAQGCVSYSEGYETSLPPLMEGRFLVYAEVPDALIEQLTDCSVVFSFNENFENKPEKPDGGTYCYDVYLDETVCATAKEGPVREIVYFDECPILPTPESFAAARQSGRSSSSTNGKTTSIRYTFTAEMSGPDSTDAIYEKYVEGLRNAGFTVQAGDAGEEIFSGSTKVAIVTFDSTAIKFDIIPGNENLTTPAGGIAPAEGASTDVKIALGSPIENDYLYLLLEEAGSDLELSSGTGSYGLYTYYSSDNGDPYYYLRGTFKNLGGIPVDIRNTYITFTFDDKYTYKGNMDGYSQNSNGFINDVSPLASVSCYVYTAVPQELIDSFNTCSIRIGFTEDFNYKTVDANNLPKFDYCDDIYVINITR